MKHNAVGWFEIPVSSMERAIPFYEKVLNIKLQRNQMGELDMAWFPMTESAPGAGGTLVCHPEWYKPSRDGVLLYFTSASDDLNEELSRVEEAGGQVHIPKKLIAPDIGYMAVFSDTEGNLMALHSRK